MSFSVGNMLSRIAAIFTVLYILSISYLASGQRNDKICDHCRKMATTGLSPYEVLWTLRGGLGKDFVPEVLERKMLLRITDIKQAEGIFLEYCRNLCLHTLEGKIWDETGKCNNKRGKTLHFQSLQEEEKYTKLAKKEFKKLKKKMESASGVKKTTEAKKKPTTERSSNKRDKSYAKIYNNLMPNLNFLNRLSSSRSLQVPLLENLTVDSTTDILNDTLELSMRQVPVQTTTMPGSDSTTDTPEDGSTTELSSEMTGDDTTEETEETTTETTSESEESTESYEGSDEDDTTEKEPEDSKKPEKVSPKSEKSQSKEDIEGLIKYLFDLTSDLDSDMIFKRVLSLTRTIVKCMIDITMTEVERALGVTEGLFVRERCGTSEEQTSFESTIVDFLKDTLEQYSNLQSVIPLAGEILLPSVLQPQLELPPNPVFQPELPPSYPDLQAPIQYYDDYDRGVPQQGISNLIPPSPIVPLPFFPQERDFEAEPVNYPEYPEPEPFIEYPDLTEPPPQPFIPSLGSANAFENFIVWRRTMSDIRNNDGSYDEKQQPQEFPSAYESVMSDDVNRF